jgi:hypothetical protein
VRPQQQQLRQPPFADTCVRAAPGVPWTRRGKSILNQRDPELSIVDTLIWSYSRGP